MCDGDGSPASAVGEAFDVGELSADRAATLRSSNSLAVSASLDLDELCPLEDLRGRGKGASAGVELSWLPARGDTAGCAGGGGGGGGGFCCWPEDRGVGNRRGKDSRSNG